MEFTKDIHFSNVLRENKKVEITYSGDLYKKQSESVSIVYGFGENWENTSEKEMTKSENGFGTEIEIKPNFDTFNFCFRNGNYEWDNNQSFNYISAIQPSIVEDSTLVEEFPKEIQNHLDSDFILEILDSIFEENISNTKNIVEEDITNSLSLEDVLTENVTPVQAPIFIEEFDMDELIENILQPVIHCETAEENFENIVNFEEVDSCVQETLKQEVENSISDLGNEQNATVLSETSESVSKENTNTALVPTSEDTYLVSPRKLSKFYLLAKKVRLAFYKLFVRMPRLLFGTLGEDKN